MNYTGTSFAEALQIAMTSDMMAELQFEVVYDLNDTLTNITRRDQPTVEVYLVAGADSLIGTNWSSPISRENILSMSGVLRIGKTSYEIIEVAPYIAYIDLHATRNVHMTSSSLASYHSISKLSNNLLIKKIPVKANYLLMLFDNAAAGYDYLHVSRRARNRIDPILQDSYGNIVDLRNNHWSFSLVFQDSS